MGKRGSYSAPVDYQEDWVPPQEQADSEQFLQELQEVLSCLRSAGFQHLQARWQRRVHELRDMLEHAKGEEMLLLQGRLACFRDIGGMMEEYFQAEREEREKKEQEG